VSDQAFVIRRVPTRPQEPEELLDDRVFLDRGAADDACAPENAAFLRPRYEVAPRRLVGTSPASALSQRLRTYFDADDDDEDHGAIRALMLEAAEEIDRLTRGL
jgi:hypothetical protein